MRKVLNDITAFERDLTSNRIRIIRWLMYSFMLLSALASSFSHASQVGNLEGELSVNSGQLNYSLPIELPPGVHGFQPSISVSYSQTNGVGIMGIGFSLSASSSISRCSPNLIEDGFFAGIELNELARFCHDGKRLTPVVGTNGAVGAEYRVLSGNDNVLYQSLGGSEFFPEYWVVKFPDGRIFTFEQVDDLDPRYSAWQLVEQQDQFGNAIIYSYSVASSTATDVELPRLEKITYAIHEVNFSYEDSSVFAEQYQGGRRAAYSKRLKAIEVRTNGNFSYEYRFGYETLYLSTPTERLISVEKCFSDESCLLPLQFGYQELPDPNVTMDSPEDQTLVISKADYDDSSTSWSKSPAYVSGDINQDGYPDFCVYKVGEGIRCALYQDTGYTALSSTSAEWSDDLGYPDTEDGYKQFNTLSLIDLNGDGFADFCIFDEQGVLCGLNDGGFSFAAPSYWSTAITQEDAPSFQNLNGDHYLDLCGFVNRDETGGGRYQCVQGDGISFNGALQVDMAASVVDNWQKAVTLTYFGDTVTGTQYLNYMQPVWLDMDGDFDQDLCWLSIGQQGLVCSIARYVPTGSGAQLVLSAPQKLMDLYLPGFEEGDDINTSAPGFQMLESKAEDQAEEASEYGLYFRFANLNGDELTDVCRIEDQNLRCSINQGDGTLSTETQWLDLSSIYGSRDNDFMLAVLSSMRLQDANHDGLSDVCLVDNQVWQCAFNQGELQSFSSFQNVHQIASDIGSDTYNHKIFANFVRKLFNASTKFRVQVMRSGFGSLVDVPDVNNDGKGDFCYRSIAGIRCSSKKQFGPTGLLASITNSYGLETSIKFGNLLGDDLYDYADTVPQGYYEIPPNIQVVQSVTTDVPVVEGSFVTSDYLQNKIDYRYGGYLKNPDVAVEGFSKLTRSNHALNSRTEIYLHVEEHLQGKEKRIESYIDNVLVNEKVNVFSANLQSDGTYKLLLEEQTETQYDLMGVQVKTATVEYKDVDYFGYPKTITETKSDNFESLTTQTVKLYHHDTERWILGRPAEQTVTHTSAQGTVVRKVKYDYEQAVLVKQTIGAGTDNPLYNHYESYDAYGNPQVTRITDNNGYERVETKTFDQLGRVLTSTDALGQKSTFEYTHPYCLGATKATDIAGNQVFTDYDVTCRKIAEYNNYDENRTTWNIEWFDGVQSKPYGQPTDLDYLNPVVFTVTESQASGPWKKTYLDAIGREIMTEHAGLTVNTDRINIQRQILTYSLYDEHNRKVAATLPVYKEDGVLGTPSWITLTYDQANRLKTETRIGPDNLPITTTYEYNSVANTTTVSASRGGYSKTTKAGIHGKPISVIENGLEVTTIYDAIGNVIETNRNGVTSTIQYDDRGFKYQIDDPAMGVWTYTYNGFGDLLTQTDARGKTTTITYEALGRKETETTEDGVTTWAYYSSGPGIGKPKSETSPVATRSWVYDEEGKVLTETLEVDSEKFITSFEYDAFSRISKTIQPDGLEVISAYDNTGQVSQIKIPANQINDVNWDKLADLYSVLLTQIIQLEAKIKDYQSLIYYHEMKALEYEARASFYQNTADELGETIAQFQQLAADHREMASQYQLQAQELLAQAAELKAQFGDKRFKYKGLDDNGDYKFEYKKCTKRAAWYSFNRCKRWDIKTVTVQAGNINTMSDHELAEYGIEEVHLYEPGGASRYVIPYHLYENVAAAYQDLAELHEQLARQADDAATVSEDNVYYELSYTRNSVDEQKRIKVNSSNLRPYTFVDNGVHQKIELEDGSYVKVDSPCFNRYCKVASWPSFELGGWEDGWFAFHIGWPNSADLLYEYHKLYMSNNRFYGEVDFGGQDGVLVEHESDIVGFRLLADGRFKYLLDNTQYRSMLLSTVFLNNEIIIDPSVLPEEVRCKDNCTFPGNSKFYSYDGAPSYENVTNVSWQKKQHYTTMLDVDVDIALVPYVPVPISVGDITFFVTAPTGDTNQFLAREDLSLQAQSEFDALYNSAFGSTLTSKLSDFPEEVVLDGIKYKTIVTREERWSQQALSRTDEHAHYLELVDYYTHLFNESKASSATLTSELTDVIDNYAMLSTQLAANEALFKDLGFEGQDLSSIAAYSETLRNSDAKLTVWAAASRTPSGQVQNEVFGNGLYTERTYNDKNGLITRIKTGSYGSGAVIRNIEYTYNARGSVDYKVDNSGDNALTEDFGYDDQGRLRTWEFMHGDQNLYREYSFDSYGNMRSKSGTGSQHSLNYDQYTQRLQSRDHNNAHFEYEYDNNGNMLSDGERIYTWGANNKVSKVTKGGFSVSFDYDGQKRRVVKRSNTETRYYVNAGYEYVIKNGEKVAQHTFFNGYEAVATLNRPVSTDSVGEKVGDTDVAQEDVQADKVVYIHRDILGSGELITDSNMDVLARRYYTPYGQEISKLLDNANGGQSNDSVTMDEATAEIYIDQLLDEIETEGFLSQIPLGSSIPMEDLRGYTSHEMLDGVGLVHMNARLYDPMIGRFISPDSIVPDMESPLAYNRYMYVRGNPASMTDPTGHFWQAVAAFFYAWTQFSDNEAVQIAGQLALMYATGGFDGLGQVSWQTAAVNAGVSSTIVTFANTGNVKQSLKSGVLSAVAAGVANSAAHGTKAGINKALGLGDPNGYKVIAFHAVSQGAINVARGGKFSAGAVSALVPKVFGKELARMEIEASPIVSAIGGGLAAAAVGGDFMRGAVTAAIVHLYNDQASAQKREPESDLEKSRVFDNQEDAAKEALSQNLEVSKEINKEIGGMVYKRPDGTYGYTCCYVGVRDTVDPGGPESVPLNTKGTAYWHTHGDHSAIYEVETFSDQDIRYADHYRIDAYLMTPNGNLLHYESGR